MSNKFKYHKEIENVKAQGICCPPDEFFVPNNLQSFRFAFEDPNYSKNHKPPGANNPKRVLTERDHKKCSLYGLSCFKHKDGAKKFFKELLAYSPNIYKSVGSILSSGRIQVINALSVYNTRNIEEIKINTTATFRS